MKTEKGDYILLRDPQAKKPLLTEIKAVKKKGLIGVLSIEERAEQGDAKFKIQFTEDDVAINFGPNPPVGSTVMGVRIEPYIGSVQLAPFSSPAALLDPLPKPDIEMIQAGAAKFRSKLKKYNALDHARHWSVAIRPKRGKHDGEYILRRSGAESLSLFTGGENTPDWTYVLWHEFGHHLWERCMTPKQKARWLGLHRKGMKFSEIGSSELTRYRSELEKTGSVKAYKKILRQIAKDEEQDENSDLARFSEVLKVSLKICNLEPKDFDTLMESGESLSDYWTKTPIPQVDRSIIITEYAMTNASELFCECLAHYMTARDMPPKIKKITGKHFKMALKNGFEAPKEQP